MTTPVAPTVEPVAAPEAAPAVTPVVEPTPVQAPETPEVAPVAAPEEAKPLTRAESLAKMREGLAKRREELTSETPKEDPEGTPEETPEVTPAEAVAAPVEGTETPTEVPPTEPAAEVVTPAPVTFTVDIDPTHPIAGLGQKTIEVRTPQEQRAVKALLNGSYTRRSEVEEARAAEKAAKQELIKIQTKLQAEDEWRSSPEYEAKVAQYRKLAALEDSSDLEPGTAAAFWKSGIPEVEAKANEAYQNEVGKLEQDEVDRAATQWTGEAFRRASQLPPNITALPNFRQYFDEAVELFGTAVAAGRYAHIKAGDAEALHNEFTRFLSGDLIRRPDVNAAYQQAKTAKVTEAQAAADIAAAKEREKAAIEKAAIEKFKLERADQRRDNPTHPLANLPASHDSTPPSAAGDEKEDLSGLGPQDFKKRSLQRARARGRAFKG